MRIVFIGTGEIGVPTLRALLAFAASTKWSAWSPSPTNRSDAHSRSKRPPIKAELAANSLPFCNRRGLRDDEAVAEIRALAPDVIVVMAYGQILPRSVLEIPRIACLNLHASLLPRHRGAAPIQAAIAAGDAETGITVIYMDEGLDTGDILLQAKLAISPDETGGSLHDRLAQLAPEALLGALDQLATGERTAHAAGSFAARPTHQS